VTRQGPSPLTLLTAFTPQASIRSKQQVHHGTCGSVKWVAIEGGGAYEGLESDGYLAIAVQDSRTGQAEVFRTGGSRLAFRGIEVHSTSADVFATIRDGKVSARTETLPPDH
jgi:hypothetical protein